jgi:hypothetical protein
VGTYLDEEKLSGYGIETNKRLHHNSSICVVENEVPSHGSVSCISLRFFTASSEELRPGMLMTTLIRSDRNDEPGNIICNNQMISSIATQSAIIKRFRQFNRVVHQKEKNRWLLGGWLRAGLFKPIIE